MPTTDGNDHNTSNTDILPSNIAIVEATDSELNGVDQLFQNLRADASHNDDILGVDLTHKEGKLFT